MFGQTRVICRLPDIPALKVMSREEVEVVLDKAMAGDPESVDLLAYWMDTAMKKPIVRIPNSGSRARQGNDGRS